MMWRSTVCAHDVAVRPSERGPEWFCEECGWALPLFRERCGAMRAFTRASRAAHGSVQLDSPLSLTPQRAALDPFEVDAQGEGLLAAQLGALALDRIRDIALAYELVPPKTAASATRAELIVEILATVSSARREPAER